MSLPTMPAPAPPLRPVVLTGNHAELQPLQSSHLDELHLAGADPELWRWMAKPAFVNQDTAREWLGQAHAEQAGGTALPFAIIDRVSGRAVGSTRLGDFRAEDRAVEIGWTWIGTAHQRTAINTECKRLLLGHAFEQLHMHRVQLKTDSLNQRSRVAIERIGAQFEGVLRNHMVRRDGSLRHSALYSILADEWPTVRQHLDGLLGRNP